MITLFHGSSFLFGEFDLSAAREGTGIKFGYGVYLKEAEASAVHYSQPRNMELAPEPRRQALQKKTESGFLSAERNWPDIIFLIFEQHV